MQTLIRCPDCGSVEVKPFYEPDNPHNVKCQKCGHTWKWIDESASTDVQGV